MANLVDRVRARAGQVLFGTGAWTPQATAALQAGDPGIVFGSGLAQDLVEGMTPAELYQTQPNLRAVIDFTSRNAAQLGRQVFRIGPDGERARARDSFLEVLLKSPNDYQTGFDLFKQLFSELALYDFHVWMIDNSRKSGGTTITGIPGEWIVGTQSDAFGRVTRYKVQPTSNINDNFYLEASDAVTFRGYNPYGFAKGSSAIKSLKSTLAEQIAATQFRSQMWKRGGRIGMYLTRPADAPEWSQEGKAKFIQQWKAQWSGAGAEAGGTPLLDEGMEMKRVGFNAREEQWYEGAQLAMVTVAQAYHVTPAMMGVAGSNSFASVKEFRKMLYTETLGPSVAQVEDTINTFLPPLIGVHDDFLELNIAEKLQGDFEEQAQVLFQAIGGPYMVPNEGRSKVNLPPIEGGDVLLAPLNMGASGNNGPSAAEPTGSDAPANDAGKARKTSHGPHADGRPAPDKKAASAISDDDLEGLAAKLAGYFDRQQRTLESALKTKDPTWWNQKQWNKELKALLAPVLLQLSAGAARKIAGAKGLDPNAYSEGETVNFLLAVSESRADLINSTTRDALKKAVDSAEDGEAGPAVKTYFEQTNASRAADVSRTLGTFVAGFAATEVAKQLMSDGDKEPTKTWVASGLPNSRHADMDGETVKVSETFSNGANWPGDPVLGAEGVANCACGVDINHN
jgi:HK97 family phage portal protein